jgi:hypothetical protein
LGGANREAFGRTYILQTAPMTSGPTSQPFQLDTVVETLFTGGMGHDGFVSPVVKDVSVTFTMFNSDGTPLRATGGAVVPPTTLTFGPSSSGERKQSIRLDDLILGAGGFDQPLENPLVLIDVPDADAPFVSLQGFVVNSHSGPFDLSVLDVGPRVVTGDGPGSGQTQKTVVFPHALETSGRVATTNFTFDTTIFMTYSGAMFSPPTPDQYAQAAWFLLDQTTGLPAVSATGQEVCNPCTFQMGAGNHRVIANVDNLFAAAGGVPATPVQLTGYAVATGDVDNVVLDAVVTNSHAGPQDLSAYGVVPRDQFGGGGTGGGGAGGTMRRTFVLPHILETSGKISSPNSFDTTIFATYVGGLPGMGPASSSSIDLYLFDEQTGEPMTGSGGSTVCNPCSLPLGASTRTLSISIEDLVVAAGGFDATGVKLGYGILVVGGDDPEGVTLQGFVVNSHSGPFDLDVAPINPRAIRDDGQPGPSTKKTFVFPHLLEQSGRITDSVNTFDTQVFVTYGAGLAGGTGGPGATVDVYLYNPDGTLAVGVGGGEVCNPCSLTVGGSVDSGNNLNWNFGLDDAFAAVGGIPDDQFAGYAMVTVSGDAENVVLSGRTTNVKSSAADLSVFVFEPQPIEAVVPEPQSCVLALLGFAALLRNARRRAAPQL